MNYNVYDNTVKMMETIINKAKLARQKIDKNNFIFSEVAIILDNDKINEQIYEIRKILKKEMIFLTEYFIPFFLFITPINLNLEDFLETNKSQYKITLTDILTNNNENKGEEIFALYRKINVLFSYYNELGDEFSFINSDRKIIEIKTEDDMNFALSANILLLGHTGVGKSK